MAGKRRATGLPLGQRREDKKQRTAAPLVVSTPKTGKQKQTGTEKKASSTIAGTSSLAVVPATPGTAVDLSATRNQNQSQVREARQEGQQKRKNQQKRQGPSQEPNMLPLEPHAAFLDELRPKYDVRMFSVISSMRMEKRIKAILNQLANQPNVTGEAGQSTPTACGAVLLHARASDAGKMISITEIVKRRIREGYFDADATPPATTDGDASVADATKTAKRKQIGKRASRRIPATAWFQYNRIYDAESEAKKKEPPVASNRGQDKGAGSHADDSHNTEVENEDEEDDGFESMTSRLQEAIRGNVALKQTAITTYMCIILSRVPLMELQRNPEFSVQSSDDPLEIEYEQWMANT